MSVDSVVQTYKKKPVSGLLFQKSPTILESIVARRVERHYPRGARNVSPNETVEFVISHDQMVDLASATLNFTINLSGSGAEFACATDVIQSIEVYYNDTLVERLSENANIWANTFLAYSANDSYYRNELDALCAVNNQFREGNSAVSGRQICIPIALISPFFRIGSYLPLFANKLRVKFTLAPNHEVVSLDSSATSVYSLDNVSMMCDTIIVSDAYKMELMRQMSSEDGIRLTYTSYLTGKHSVSASTSNILRISNNLSSLLSIFVLYNNKSEKGTTNGATHRLYAHSFPLTDFKECYGKIGNVQITPSDRIKGHAEAYVAVEKCVNSMLTLEGSGIIDWKTFTSGYTKNASTVAGTYGVFLLGFNCEKSLAPDDSNALNAGLSAVESSSDIDIEIVTNNNKTATDEWLYSLVHTRSIVWSNNAVEVEY